MKYIKDTLLHTALNFETQGEENLIKKNDELHSEGFYIEATNKEKKHLGWYTEDDIQEGGK